MVLLPRPWGYDDKRFVVVNALPRKTRNDRANHRTTDLRMDQGMEGTSGSPKRREAYGDGILVVPQKENSGVVFLREGAALEGGPERVSDPDAQERYQEVTTCKGMRNAINRCVFRASS